MILHNLAEFYRFSLGLIAYHSDNLYFKFLSTRQAKYILNRVLSTKFHPLCLIAVGSTLAMIGQIYWFHFNYDATYYSLMIVSLCVATLLININIYS